MKHKHYDMIVAKAANMDLVVFCKSGGEWRDCKDGIISWGIEFEYFLCLPQHKDACLHWLNGGKLLVDNGKGLGVGTYTLNIDNHRPLGDFINHYEYKFSIKPRKEKRWIAINTDGYVMPIHCGSKESVEEHAKHTKQLTCGAQFIEIEVEV